MKTSQINNRIKDLRNGIRNNQNVFLARENAQILFLEIKQSEVLTDTQKERLLIELRKAVRPLSGTDYKNGNDICEINSFLSEICLAASFYLLEKGKHIRLYETAEDALVSISKRAFENCFLSVISRMFSENDEVTVEIKLSGCYCCVVISADIIDFPVPENLFGVFEYGMPAVAINMKKIGQVPETIEREDFSLLLSDSLSPVQIWLCDI